MRALRALFFRAVLTVTVLMCCALPPTLVVGGLVFVAQAAETRDAGPAMPAPQGPASSGLSSDVAAASDAAVAPLADVERSELARARPPMSSAAARILAEGNASMSALAAAADALPNRRDIRMGAISADERLVLAAQLYRPHIGYHEDGAPTVTVLLQARPGAADNVSQALRSADLVQLRLRLLRETADLLELMNARDPAENGTVKSTAGNGNSAGARGSGNLGNVYRAPVGMHDAPDFARQSPHGGDARKNALDEAFSGRAGAQAPSALAGFSGAAAGSPAAPDAASAVPEPFLTDAVWTERHWNRASRQLQALLQAQDSLEFDPEGWLVPDGHLPRLEQASALLPQSPAAWLLLAEAQLRRGLPLQSIASCDAGLALDSGLNRARYIRALGHWRLQQLALAEGDLTSSLDDRHGLAPQGEDRARRLRARGAVRMQRRDMAGMCEDFGAACALGECEELILARAQQHCLPDAATEPQGSPHARQHSTPASPEGETSGVNGAAASPADPPKPDAATGEAKP